MKLSQFTKQALPLLKRTSPTPSQDIELLLCYALNKPKEWVLLNQEYEIPQNTEKRLKKYIQERLDYTPLEYITKEKYFYSNLFYLTNNTLIPRPETEILVDESIKEINTLLKQKNIVHILEIGTGTACIPISIIQEIKKGIKLFREGNFKINITSTELSKKALQVAFNNANRILKGFSTVQKTSDLLIKKFSTKSFTLNFNIVHADIHIPFNKSNFKISPSNMNFDLFISNPPYIPTLEMKNLDAFVQKEPPEALNGGKQGIQIIQKIFSKTIKQRAENAVFLIEIHPPNAQILKKYIEKNYEIRTLSWIKDLSGKKRFIRVETI
ncbi:hypothetical protein GF362_05285 [Candidatus Dojkabacteria bacterium]|nr:hypothetical protein [Candidatus Dojkabacteria bacterium]